jgi:hypothetical protein
MQRSYNPKVEVMRSARFGVPAASAWALLRDFDAMPSWNASVRSSRIEEGPADRVGCLRVLVFDDGGIWTHRLSGLSDEDMKLQYRIVGTPQAMPIALANYRAEIAVQPDPQQPQQSCTVSWRAEFETDRPETMRERAAAVFEAGLAGLRRCLEPA